VFGVPTGTPFSRDRVPRDYRFMNTLNRAWQFIRFFRQHVRTWHNRLFNSLFFLYSSCRTVPPIRELGVIEAWLYEIIVELLAVLCNLERVCVPDSAVPPVREFFIIVPRAPSLIKSS
jgi:hypothetical protein